MNVNGRESGTKTTLVRAVTAALALLALGGLVLGASFGSGSRQNSPAQATTATAPTNLLSTAGTAESRLSRSRVLAAFGQLPLIFEPNVGQTDPSVKFLAHGDGYRIFLGADGATLSLRSSGASGSSQIAALHMTLPGANLQAKVQGMNPLPGKTNYFIGGDPSHWHINIPQFAGVRYESAYPGIDLIFYGDQGKLEYDFRVAPGSDPSQAELAFDDSARLELTGGDLTIATGGGSVRLAAPRIYQNVDGRHQAVDGRFALRSAHRVGFEVGAYDRSRDLIIDPVLTYSTYFGGSGTESCPSFVAAVPVTPGCPAIAVDGAGEIFLAGATTSPPASFPQPGAGTTLIQGSTNANIYVAKLSNTGQSLLYLTFLGGGGTDVPCGLAVDGAGDAFLAGTTTSGINGTADFPPGLGIPYQSAPEAGSTGTAHVFVAELNGGTTTTPAGSQLVYSSYLSGNGTDIATGMAIDNSQNIYVTGTTTSTDSSTSGNVNVQFPASTLPERPPFQAFSLATTQFFVTKVNPGAAGIASIVYSTYFGGGVPTNGTAIGGGIVADTNGNIYFTGTTNFLFTGTSPTTDFPIVNAYQPCLDQIPPTVITNPVTCTIASPPPTATDAFVAKLNPNQPAGTAQLVWSTYLGGAADDTSTAIATDTAAANIYVVGSTNSSPFTTLSTFGGFQTCLNVPPPNPATCTPPNTNTDAFVARLSNPTTGNVALTYFSYLGGSSNDAALGVAVDTAGDAQMTGWTQSSDFPTTPGPIQSTFNPTQDAFFAHINTTTVSGQTQVGAYSTYFGGNGITSGTSVTVDNSLNAYMAGATNSTNLETATPLQAVNHSTTGGSNAFATKLSPAANLSISGVLSLGVGQQYVYAGNSATFTYTITNEGPDLATDVLVNDDLSDTGVPVTVKSASISSGVCSQTTSNAPIACSVQSLQVGQTVTVTITLVPGSTTGQLAAFNGGAVTATSANNVAQGNKYIVSGQVSDFSISVTPTSQSVVAAGDSATYTVLLTPHPIYATGIALSVSLPTGASMSDSFSSGTVTLNTPSPSSSTLKINTTVRPTTTAGAMTRRGAVYAFWLALPGGMVFFGFGKARGRRRIAALMFLCAVLLLLVLQPACGSTRTPTPVSGTPAGTYTMVVTGTSGSVSHSQSIQLTVP